MVTAGVEAAVVGFTHGQEERCRAARHQLEHVGDEGRSTKTKGVDSCGQKVWTLALLPQNHLDPHTFIWTCTDTCSAVRMRTDEADGPADEGVEVAPSSVNVGLSGGAAAPPGLTAEEDGLSHHDLTTEESHVRLVRARGRAQRLAGAAPAGRSLDLLKWQVQRRPG